MRFAAPRHTAPVAEQGVHAPENAGIIVDSEMLDVRFRNGRSLGKIEERFAASLRPGDTF